MSDAQERAWAEHSPKYLVDVPRHIASTSVDPQARLDLQATFGRSAPVTMEIGSGQGHAIVAAATAHPERDFLAVEVYRAGLARTVFNAEDAGLTNLRLVEANAPEVLDSFLPAGSLDELWIFFPDPWHKKRHTKRRMVKEGFGPSLRRALRPGGLVRLATDWEDYAIQMREVLDGAPEVERTFSGDWAPRYEGRVMTAFERKGLEKGRVVRDLTYRRV
ncbi:tRNA (guanosine(46)-N7)-methyltransferase TrmB [Brevibacterium litoralis]|uniref:tRNA (guanosine(46)-N7)-methyltransferase TrmB n=1 Tax=Brevibacterium litoralis TaxID=3138935 RepID=UPI0032EEB234